MEERLSHFYTTNNDSQLLVVPENVSKIRRAKDKGGEKKEFEATTAGVLQRRPPVWKVQQADLWVVGERTLK